MPLSRRAFLEEAQQEQRQAFLDELKSGEIRAGVVSSVVNFGAFVDLGGMDGLVHVSELSWQHVSHPSEVVSVGDKVKVKVLEVDVDRQRIGLSLRLNDAPGAGKPKQSGRPAPDQNRGGNQQRNQNRAKTSGRRETAAPTGSMADALRNAGFGR